MAYDDMKYDEFDELVADELPLAVWLRPRLKSETFLTPGVNAVLIYKQWGENNKWVRLEVAVMTEIDWEHAISVTLGVITSPYVEPHPVPIPVVTPDSLAQLISDWRIVNRDGNADGPAWVVERFQLDP